MKQNRIYPRAVITKKQMKRVQAGHPWIYADEILTMDEEIPNGSLVDVFSEKGSYAGTGFFSAQSKIRIRLLSRNANDVFDEDFFRRRIRYAIQYRRDVMKDDFSACRLVHGESDLLPGLTVDRYNDILVTEIASYGMEQIKDVIYQALIEEMRAAGEEIHGIYERNENALRAKEGLAQYKGWYGKDHPAEPVTIIRENGLFFEVDVENGQKTGFFLDQKYNRRAVRWMASGRTVLDCCTHTGSFALHAASGGAAYVKALDISASALEQAKRNAALNHLEDKVDFVQADVFEALAEIRAEHEHYDFIILDPPAFTKSRRTQHNAYQGYTEINAAAMKILPRGGYLATCSCSHFMPRDMFVSMLHEAAMAAGVQVRIVEERHASPDHPVLIGVDETDYLKYFLVQII
jgi:23S rRNA (cytosine1962-C5)-methyltransferase